MTNRNESFQIVFVFLSLCTHPIIYKFVLAVLWVFIFMTILQLKLDVDNLFVFFPCIDTFEGWILYFVHTIVHVLQCC